MAEIDNVFDNSLGRELIHASGLARHNMHEGAPGARTVSHNGSNRMFAFLLAEVCNFEQTFLGETCIVHVEYWDGSAARTLM